MSEGQNNKEGPAYNQEVSNVLLAHALQGQALCMLAVRLWAGQAAKLMLSSQDRLEPVSVPSSWAYLVKYWMRLGPPWELVRLGPHSMPPLMILVVVPKPDWRPAAESAADGCHSPVMTSWHEGLLPADVILRTADEVTALLASPMTAADVGMHSHVQRSERCSCSCSW